MTNLEWPRPGTHAPLGPLELGWWIESRALEQAERERFTEQQILDVLQNPAVRWPRRYGGQVRYVGGTDPALCIVVVEKQRLVIAVQRRVKREGR